jgi:hypothetical protein
LTSSYCVPDKDGNFVAELALSGYPFHVWALPYAGPSLFSFPSRRQDLAYLLELADQIPLITDFYTKAAVEADGAEMEAIRACCTKNSIRAVVGFSERDGGSLYMSQWIIGPEGDVVVRRKFRPTSLERIVFGDGDVRSAFLPSLLATSRTISSDPIHLQLFRDPTSRCTGQSSATSVSCSVG